MNMRDGASLLNRSRDFVLASLVLEYPGEEILRTLEELATHLRAYPSLLPLVEAAMEGIEPLQMAYSAVFDSGTDRVSPYETEHGPMRGAAKGNDLADIAGFYRAFHVTLDDERVHEMLDHVAVELEFYGHLLLKEHVIAEAGDLEGCAIVEDARRKFLEDHLGRFVTTLANRPAAKDNCLYGPALAWCAELVATECQLVGASPAPLDFFPDAGERDDTSCGAVRLPVLN